ncbi:MAG: pentapeptide repeat-containing protein, partial [Pseudomonadota bacterium]|nr:pentapeptide repeat-containing protein [Pseudomonadota bacterium]
MSAAAPQIITPVDISLIKAMLSAHARYLEGRPGGQRANFSYKDLRNCGMEGMDLREVVFSGAVMSGALLASADLAGAILYGVDLRNADLRCANLIRADLRGACLRGANLSGADLTACDLREGQIAFQDPKNGFRLMKHQKRAGELSYAILTGATLADAQMTGLSAAAADFRDANLSGASLNGARLQNAVLDGADLSNAQLREADLSGASLKKACVAGSTIAYAQTDKGALDDAMGAPPPMVFVDDVPLAEVLAGHERWCVSEGREGLVANASKSDFRSAGPLKGRKLTALKAAGSIFYGLNLEGIQLQGADLTGADLRGANLRGADLRGAKLIDALLVRADLRGAK